MDAVELNRLRERTRSAGDAGLVVLFGSVARGQAAPWSDVDVGVSGISFWRALDLGSNVGAVLGREPHVVDLDTASDWLRYLVAREGLLLHEGQPLLWARFRAQAALRYFDLQPLIARCAEGVRQSLLQGPTHG